MEKARHTALSTSRVPETVTANACCAYNKGVRGDVPGALAAKQPGGDYHTLLRENEVSAFAVPFYDMFILTLPVGARIHNLARASIASRWTTSWGPGRIVNDLLFAGKRIGPSAKLIWTRPLLDHNFRWANQWESSQRICFSLNLARRS